MTKCKWQVALFSCSVCVSIASQLSLVGACRTVPQVPSVEQVAEPNS
jgi:hypothetical protein